MSLKDRASQKVKEIQESIVNALEKVDGNSFHTDTWKREGGGGGRTCVISDGNIIEKGGVNFSEVYGTLSEEFSKQLPGSGLEFYATGVSLVLHPRNPRVPTVHANFRYIQRGEAGWFGGGADLTPYVLYPEDAQHFHQVWKSVCDRHHPEYHSRFKKWCDEYFFLKHREEARGVGGIFFDYLDEDPDKTFDFWADAGDHFLESYLPIVERRVGESSTESERQFQLIRRGRYVEFNLVYDRGTVFGLKTGGRIESILMSLPPVVHFPYDPQVEPESPEARLLEVLREPRDWV